MKKIKLIKAWALIGSDKEIASTSGQHSTHTGQLAIYETRTLFDKKIMKDYKLKRIPVLITPLTKKKK